MVKPPRSATFGVEHKTRKTAENMEANLTIYESNNTENFRPSIKKSFLNVILIAELLTMPPARVKNHIVNYTQIV